MHSGHARIPTHLALCNGELVCSGAGSSKTLSFDPLVGHRKASRVITPNASVRRDSGRAGEQQR